MRSEFEIRVTTGSMYRFLMYHVYHGFRGIFSFAAGLALLVLFFTSAGNGKARLALLAAVLFFFYEPFIQFVRAAKQIRHNPVFRKPLRYQVTERGITVSQDQTVNEVSWETVVRICETRKSFYVYTGARNAFIWEKEQMDGEAEKVREMLGAYVSPVRKKRRKVGADR